MSRATGARQPYNTPQNRLTARPDEIQTRRPMLAASLQMQKGWEGQKGPRPSRWYWYDMPETRPIPNGTEDLTGRRLGSLVCVGLAPAKGNSGGQASWVMRCDCGMFEVRTAKAIRSQKLPWAACTKCEYTTHTRRRHFFDTRGRWPTDEEVARWVK